MNLSDIVKFFVFTTEFNWVNFQSYLLEFNNKAELSTQYVKIFSTRFYMEGHILVVTFFIFHTFLWKYKHYMRDKKKYSLGLK